MFVCIVSMFRFIFSKGILSGAVQIVSCVVSPSGYLRIHRWGLNGVTSVLNLYIVTAAII